MKIWAHIVLGLCLGIRANAQGIFPILQTGHTAEVTYVMIDGESTLVSGDVTGRVVLWDMATQQQIGAIDAIRGRVNCLDYRTDSAVLVVATAENLLYVHRSKAVSTEVIESRYPFTSVAISKDAQLVAAGADDGSFWLIGKDAQHKMDWGTDVRGVCLTADGRFAYIGLYNGEVHRINTTDRSSELIHTATASIQDMCLSPDERLIAYSCVGINQQAGELGVLDIRRQKPLFSQLRMSPFALQVRNRTLGFSGKRELTFLDSAGVIRSMDLRRGTERVLLEGPQEGFALSGSAQWLAFPAGKRIRMVHQGHEDFPLEFAPHVDPPLRFLSARGHRLLVEYASGIKEWDLRTLEVEMRKEKLYSHEWDRYDLSTDGNYWADDIWLRYGMEGEVKTSFRGHRQRRVAGAFSPDNSYYAWLDTTGLFSMLQVDSLEDGQYLTSEKHTRYVQFGAGFASGGTQQIVFHPTRHEVVVMGPNLQVFDLDSGIYWSVGREFRDADFILPGVYNPHDGLFLAAARTEVSDSIAYEGNDWYSPEWRSTGFRSQYGTTWYRNVLNGVVYMYDLHKRVYERYLIREPSVDPLADVTALLYNPHDSTIIQGFSDGHIAVLNAADSVYSYRYLADLDEWGLQDLFLSEDGKYLFCRMKEGSIQVLGTADYEPICKLIAMNDDEYLVMDPENYYKRSKRPANGVAFWDGRSISQLNQFDQRFNRPDRIYEAMGLMSTADLKTLKQMGEGSKDELVLNWLICPKLEITNADQIQYTTVEEEVRIAVLAKSNGVHELAYLKIWVNGIPFFDEGAEPNAGNADFWESKWDIPLAFGENLIKVQAFDSYGLKSNEQTLRIQCNKPYVRPDLYLGILSVSHYADSSMDLQYAVKDGRDLASVFLQADGRKTVGFPSRFGTIHLDTFFDAQATRANVLQWKKKLINSRPEDYVILFVSGHGLLDTAMNFWFATHNMDFSDPARNGLSFSGLEELLMGFPARQRLLLMDACHSGEVLESPAEVDTGFVLPDGGKGQLIGFGTKGLKVQNRTTGSLNREELKQQMFSNYKSRSGATVIAAASGSSFALESPEWSNGIFTYTVIGGMIYRWADLNHDGEVSVVELSKYVTRQVKEQTHGLQIPNDRQENMENNFRIW